MAEDFRAENLVKEIKALRDEAKRISEKAERAILTPQWISFRTKILEVLEAYPEARVKLAEVLDNEPGNL